MRLPLAVVTLVICAAAVIPAYSETNFDTIRFIQYLNDSEALEDVRQGNIDMYYWPIPSEMLSDPASREGIMVHESIGTSYNILLNPAQSDDAFNPFAIRDIRFALNYMIDRDFIVDELMDGHGSTLVAWYGKYSSEYILIVDLLESYNFEYDSSLAQGMIRDAMINAGGVMTDGIWMVDDVPVEIRFFIRGDDPIREAIGEALAAELQSAGFVVHKGFGNIHDAFAIVYGSDPAGLGWHLYTEGWVNSGLAKYDTSGLSQMYAPWFFNMPGFGIDTYWNYEHPELDRVTKAIYTGNVSSAQERTDLIREGIALGVEESVRIFLADHLNQFVVRDGIDGVVNDFDAGIPGRFTTINARSDQTILDIGVKHVYHDSWNPVAGMYGNSIWNVLYDPPMFLHPYSGDVIPIRAEWDVQTAGPDGVLPIPADAILWDVKSNSWMDVGEGADATSVVTFHFTFGNWHHGIPMSMDDILYVIYFLTEWGTAEDIDDPTFDPRYAQRVAQGVESIKGVRVLDENTVEVYVDYWHFDDNQIASWASVESAMPWELYHAMAQAVLDDRTAFSLIVSQSKGVSRLSVLMPDDANLVREYLVQFRDSGVMPDAIPATDAMDRYDAAISWIDQYGHAVISNGPYMMMSYSPEPGIITLEEFDDITYPFGADKWSEFESVILPQVSYVSIPDIITVDVPLKISVYTAGADRVLYFVTDADGAITQSGEADVSSGGIATVNVDTTTQEVGHVGFKVFAVSDTVLRPDSYSTDFLVVDAITATP